MHNIAVPSLHICNKHTCPVHSCTTSCKIHTCTKSCNIHTCTIPFDYNFPHIYIYVSLWARVSSVIEKTPPERTNLIGVRIVNVLCWPPVLHLKEHFWNYTPMAMLFDLATASQLSDDETLPKFSRLPLVQPRSPSSGGVSTTGIAQRVHISLTSPTARDGRFSSFQWRIPLFRKSFAFFQFFCCQAMLVSLLFSSISGHWDGPVWNQLIDPSAKRIIKKAKFGNVSTQS